MPEEKNNKIAEKKVGAVAVIGAGIGGMQSSLDLAESGYKVYLVESSPAIGGNMARLDKTFPTNDCAMCVMSPKLVDCGRHLNIEILTYSEIESIEGKPGNFKLKIKKKARSVDLSKCTGCEECTRNCPVRYKIQPPPPRPLPGLKEKDKIKIDKIISDHKEEKGALIPILQEVNKTYNYLPRDILNYLSVQLEMPLASILRVASFYNTFSLEPRGRHLIEVCLGTACFVKGSNLLTDKLERDLEIESGQTTKDLRFTLDKVRCLGCCALAPVIRIDGDIYGGVKQSQLENILKPYT